MQLKHIIFLVGIVNALNAEGFKVNDASIFARHHLGKLEVTKTDKGYEILKDGTRHTIKPYDVDPLLKKLNKEKLAEFLNSGAGYIEVSQLDNQDYTLKAKVRGEGGGPVLGMIGYWATKAICYGTAVAGVSAGVAATGGVAGAVTASMATVGTLGAPASAAVVGSAIAGAGYATEAAMVTVSVVSQAGGLAGAVALVESAATTVGAILTAVPFL